MSLQRKISVLHKPPPQAQIPHGRGKLDDPNMSTTVKETDVCFKLLLRERTDNKVDPRLVLRQTMARLCSIDQNILLLTQTTDDTLVILGSAIHIYIKRIELQKYFTHLTNHYKMRGIFKIRTKQSLLQIKESPGLWGFLDCNRVFFKVTKFKTAWYKAIGYLLGSHNCYTQREGVVDEINKRMTSLMAPPFQLYP